MTVLLFSLVWKQINQKTTWDEIVSLYREGFEEQRLKWFLLALFLVPINWGVEVVKWQEVMKKVKPISFLFSVKAVLLGVVFSMYTPNRVGEYGGRVILLKEKRWESFFATMMGSFSQIAANTFWSGGFSLLFIYKILPASDFKIYYFPVILISIIGALLLYTFVHHFGKINWNVSFFHKIKEGISIFKTFNFKDKRVLFLISSSRFFVYVMQYYFLLQFFDVAIPFNQAIISIGCLFFVQTVIPTVAMVELGIRGILSLAIFGYLSDNVAGILDATFTLWILNLVLPSIGGLIILLRINLNPRD